MFAKKSNNSTTKQKLNGPFFSPLIQPKLNTENAAIPVVDSPLLQQKGEEEEAQAKVETVQMQEEEEMIQAMEEEEVVQTKLQLAEEEEAAQTKLQFKGQPRGSNAVHSVAKSGFTGSGGAYPFMNQIKASFGKHDVSQVKAYSDGAATKANKSLGALAYASGEKVAFKKAPDLHTAAHEAAHVIQQKKGVQLKNGLGTKNDKYERHADAVADKVVQGKSAEVLLSNSPTGPSETINRKSVQFDRGLATAWDVYVYPGHADPSWSDESTENARSIGSQVRSFQSLRGRSQSRENGNRVVNVESGHLDRGANNTRFQDSQTATSIIPHVWWLEVVDNVLFDGAPVPADLTQRGLADCFILAPLQAMAANAPSRAKLQTNAQESGGKYQVDLHRLQIIGGDCIPHPTDMIRVRMDSVISGRAVRGATNTTPLTAAEITAARAQDPNISPTDIVLGNITKRILWPWAYEKAFASVTGSYSGIDFGSTGMAMMVLTGNATETLGVDPAKTAALFNFLAALLTQNKIAAAGTKQKPQLATQGYHSYFSIVEATEADGVKVRSGLTGPVSNWIPWNTFFNHTQTCIIMNFENILGANKVIIPVPNLRIHKNTLIDASKESFVVITGQWWNHLVFGNNLWVGPQHAYSVSAASAATVDLRNPWGKLHLNGLSQTRFSEIFLSFSIEL